MFSIDKKKVKGKKCVKPRGQLLIPSLPLLSQISAVQHNLLGKELTKKWTFESGVFSSIYNFD